MVEQSFVLVYIWHATVLLIFVATAACKLVLQIFAPVDHNLRAYGPTGRAFGLRARLQAYGPGPLAYDTGSTGPRAYGPYGPTGRAYGPTGPDLGLPRGQWPCIYIYITISLVGGYRFYGISPTMY